MLGPERGSKGRRRGLAARLADISSYDEQGAKAIADSYSIRRNALLTNIPYFTTIAAGLAAVDSLEVSSLLRGAAQVRSIQEWHSRSNG